MSFLFSYFHGVNGKLFQAHKMLKKQNQGDPASPEQFEFIGCTTVRTTKRYVKNKVD